MLGSGEDILFIRGLRTGVHEETMEERPEGGECKL